MNDKSLIAALLIILFPFSAAAAPARNEAAISHFASGLKTLVNTGNIHDPITVAKLLNIRLKNPDKWSGQPNGTSRRAQWRSPVNQLGITDVIFNDTALGANIENNYTNHDVAFDADFQLSRHPCVRVLDIERGVGKQAKVSNVISLEFHYHPQLGSPRQIAPDKRTSFILIQNSDGYDVTISMHVDRLGRFGCLRSIGLQSNRPIARLRD